MALPILYMVCLELGNCDIEFFNLSSSLSYYKSELNKFKRVQNFAKKIVKLHN
jgi:hypothetical protein